MQDVMPSIFFYFKECFILNRFIIIIIGNTVQTSILESSAQVTTYIQVQIK